jgi:Tfp pilus assembly protein PilF
MGDSMRDLPSDFANALKYAKAGDLASAMDLYTKILFEAPNFTPAWNQRGLALLELGHPFDAILSFGHVISLDPDKATGYVNRGTGYLNAEYYDRAIGDFKRAEEIDPKLAVAPNNLGNALYLLNDLKAAETAYRRAIKADPDYADGHLGVGISLLKQGQFEEGWREFEWRWKNGQLPPRGLPYPQWDGWEAYSQGETLLVYGEQGMGDVLQFCRLAPMAKSVWGGKIHLEVVPPLLRTVRSLHGIDGISALGEKLPDNITACIPMMSLPGLLGIKQIEDIPSEVPYLRADRFRSNIWQERLKQLPPGLRVGLCWAGGMREKYVAIDQRRSLALSDFKPLASIPGINWVSLQLGAARPQVKNPPVGMSILDCGDDLWDWFDTGALIDSLDLIITVDTAVAHMAGALAKPVWLLSRFDGCWRWLQNREDSPWYPTMRIFNQQKPHEWGEVVERIANELRHLVRKKRAA